MLIIKRYIRNMRDGYHHNSSYWKNIRMNLPILPGFLREIAIAMVLSDAGLAWTSNEVHMKIEQGYKKKNFVFKLFDLFKDYCFSVGPQEYVPKKGVRAGLVKSYWFKTFSHPSFTEIWNLFYIDGVKTIQPGIVVDNLSGLGLAYWIMSDGSLQKDHKTMIIHSQSFTQVENELLSKELNAKFGLDSCVIPHKDTYWVIQIPAKDAAVLYQHIAPHMLPYFNYKLPIL